MVQSKVRAELIDTVSVLKSSKLVEEVIEVAVRWVKLELGRQRC